MSRQSTAIALSALLAASACSPAATQIKPPVVPAQFSTTGSAALPDRWWLALGDPSLDALIDEGLAHNPGVLAVWDRLAQADAVARRERSSIYPSVDYDASAGVSARGGDSGASGDTSLSLGLAASYEIDLWGRVKAGRQAADIDARASAEDVQAAAISLSAQIASTWYQLVEQYGQYDLLLEQLDTSKQTLDRIQLLYERGLKARTDLMRQQQLVESINGSLAQTQASTAVLEHQLAILLGKPPTTKVAARTTTLVELGPLPATGVPAALMQRRPDVVSAYLSIQSADRRLAAAIADRFPRLSLSARATTSGSTPQDLFTGWLTSLVANLTGPLFDAGERKAEVERSRAVVSERVHSYSGVVLSAMGEVEDALVNEQHQRDYLASLDRQLELATQVLDRVREAYNSGNLDYLSVLDAEKTQQGLERNRRTAERQLIEYRISLYRALAGGWAMSPPRQEG